MLDIGFAYVDFVQRRKLWVFYKVWYQSMTAFYGPHVVEAEDEQDARSQLARSMGTQNYGCIEAKSISLKEAMAMKSQDR